MRWHVITTLVRKDFWRHRADRGGLALVGLLIGTAALLGIFGRQGASGAAAGLTGGAVRCIVNYDDKDPFSDDWVSALRVARNRDPEFARTVLFRPFSRNTEDAQGRYLYGTAEAAVQIHRDGAGYKVWTWFPAGTGPAAVAPYEEWFFRESRRFFADRAVAALRDAGVPTPPKLTVLGGGGAADDFWLWREAHDRFRDQVAAAGKLLPSGATPPAVPELTFERSGLGGASLDVSSLFATVLVLFGLFFSCLYILSAMLCEERERGILLAQALSPASPAEILAAKVLFYPTAGVFLGATIALIYDARVLAQPFFWLTLAVLAVGSFGIGMTVACLARTQRAASMGTLVYTMGVALVLMICQQYNVPVIPYLALEYYGPRVLHAAMSRSVNVLHWLNLGGAAVLAVAWNAAAVRLFRRRGWQ